MAKNNNWSYTVISVGITCLLVAAIIWGLSKYLGWPVYLAGGVGLVLIFLGLVTRQ